MSWSGGGGGGFITSTYFDLPLSPSLQFGQVQATLRSLVLETELAPDGAADDLSEAEK